MGFVTKEPVLRTGKDTGNKYLRLNLAVDKGFGDNKKSVFYQATFYGAEAERLVKAKVKKGSFIVLDGDIEEVLLFQKEDSEEMLSMIKVRPYSWRFVPIPSRKGEGTAAPEASDGDKPAAHVDPADFREVECGVNGELPA